MNSETTASVISVSMATAHTAVDTAELRCSERDPKTLEEHPYGIEHTMRTLEEAYESLKKWA